MRIFNLETGSIGILSEHAKTAKWNNSKNQFKEIKQNAFKYQSIEELNNDKSHLIQNIFPKPDSDIINSMNSRYFSEQCGNCSFWFF